MTDWHHIALNHEPTGSRVICDPPPMDTDEDHIVLVSGASAYEWLTANGFSQCGLPQFYTGNDAGGFRSWRRGELNLITTESPEFYERFTGATHIARRFNLTDKGDRIALFQVVLYGVAPHNLEQPTPARAA